ncbi:MAG: hypothetical protein IJQ89_03915 [Bacteroidales bacterium]|nr:hypothetical protein [Bacteroidales bacterium]
MAKPTIIITQIRDTFEFFDSITIILISDINLKILKLLQNTAKQNVGLYCAENGLVSSISFVLKQKKRSKRKIQGCEKKTKKRLRSAKVVKLALLS